MVRAVVDRILVALALMLGVHLPGDADTLTAALLVGMALLDGVLRWRERTVVQELLDRLDPAERGELAGRVRGMARWSGIFRRP